VWLGTDLTVTKNTALDVPTWTEDFDKNDMFDTSTPSRLTIPSTYDGLYTIRGVIRVPMSSGSSDDSPIWYARIVKGGATVMSEARTPFLNAGYNNDGTIGDQTLIVECVVEAVGGNYFELEVFYNVPSSGAGAATLDVVAGVQNTYFEAYRHRSPLVVLPPVPVGDPIYSSNASSTDSHSVALPLGARQAGDMILFIFSPRANPTLILEPSGYTQAGNSGAESTVHDHYVYFRRVTAAEAGGGTVAGWELSIARESVAVAFHLRDVHASQAPEMDFGMGTGSANSDCDVTPSWGTDLTFWLGAASWDAANDLTAVPSGWTGTDVEVADPDQKKTATAAIGAATLEQAGAQVTFGDADWPISSGSPDLGTLIAIRGKEVS
jgi:hypothetical protein